jgi:putative FmdB family regulatory protein
LSARIYAPEVRKTTSLELNCNLFNADFPALSGERADTNFLMPTYEYSCQKCGQNFEAFQSMRDEPYRECPKELCRLPKWGHGKVKRLLGTGAGLIFKGSGFYITDYRSDSYKEAAKKESPQKPATVSDKSSAPKETTKESSPAQAKTPEKKPAKESG